MEVILGLLRLKRRRRIYGAMMNISPGRNDYHLNRTKVMRQLEQRRTIRSLNHTSGWRLAAFEGRYQILLGRYDPSYPIRFSCS